MEFVDLVFYLLSTVAVMAAVMVISVRNPVHSVLFLVLTFFNVAGLFVLLEAEFLAAILVMVYMGAVAVLFLFVVMMLDVDFSRLRQGMVQHLPLGLAVGLIFLAELVVVGASAKAGAIGGQATAAGAVNNVAEIGRVLYSRYLYPFELASLILLVALVGAVVLTLRDGKRPGVKQQDIAMQLSRTRDQAVQLKKVKSGEGA